MKTPTVVDIVGIHEIAKRLDARRQTVAQWRFRDQLPAPDGYVSGSPWWHWRTIETWARQSDRLPATNRNNNHRKRTR